jgi:hypothetical protein
MNSPITNEHSLHGARLLDAAKGILVGLRGYTMADAFSEILCTATEYGVGRCPSHTLYWALPRAAGKHTTHPPTRPPSRHKRRWYAIQLVRDPLRLTGKALG